MKIQIFKVDAWSETFFEEFLSAKIFFEQGHVSKYLKPNLMDFKKEFLSPYFINNAVKFRAIILRDESNSPVGQVVLYYKHNRPGEIIFGHFNVNDSPEVSEVLFREMDQFCAEVSAKKIKGPMQGHFFFSYRLKICGDDNFYGEPMHPESYHDVLEKNGFSLLKTWETTRLNWRMTSSNFKNIRRSSRHKNKKFKKLKIKYIFPWRWNTYLKDILQLFNETYKNMESFEELDELTFKTNYDSFKYLINPFLSYLVTYKGRPVGFSINYFDPLNILYNFQQNQERTIIPEKIRVCMLLIRLYFNKTRLLGTYVGKLEEIDGEKVKGVTALCSKQVNFFVWLFRIKEVLVCYRAEEGDANKSFNKNNETVIAQYGMYQRVVKAIQ